MRAMDRRTTGCLTLAAALAGLPAMACKGKEQASDKQSASADAADKNEAPQDTADQDEPAPGTGGDETGGSGLAGTVETAPPEIQGFDTWASVTSQASELASAGYGFGVRYVTLSSERPNLTQTEAEAILAAGMALMVVQEGPEWRDRAPSAELGTRYGTVAREQAETVGYPAKAVLWADLESVETGDADDISAYLKAWRDAVAITYAPGLYVGPSVPLTDEQLAALPFEHFWRSGATQLSPTGRGYQMTQHAPVKVAGVTVDVDRTQNDEQGQAARWLQPPGWTPPPPSE